MYYRNLGYGGYLGYGALGWGYGGLRSCNSWLCSDVLYSGLSYKNGLYTGYSFGYEDGYYDHHHHHHHRHHRHHRHHSRHWR